MCKHRPSKQNKKEKLLLNLGKRYTGIPLPNLATFCASEKRDQNKKLPKYIMGNKLSQDALAYKRHKLVSFPQKSEIR